MAAAFPRRKCSIRVASEGSSGALDNDAFDKGGAMAHWYQKARDFLAVGFVIMAIMGVGGIVVVGSEVLARSLGWIVR